jgi:hypothetical protein
MGDEALAVWDKTVTDLEAMGLASPADAWPLACYVEAVVLHARANGR